MSKEICICNKIVYEDWRSMQVVPYKLQILKVNEQ